jgi:N-acetylglutamate synthase-like GNAT family acetyltransferase|tara:strand:- start:726 stop:1130 length:405 start_codon:yes stop_codon:yes gene_type:complete
MQSKVNIRKIELKDYEYIDKWWIEQGYDAISKEILPMQGLGGLIVEKEKPIAAAYLYLTNSKMGYIDNLISDPKYVSKDRFDVIANLMAACKKMAEDVGCLDIWAITNNKGILKRCKKLGYNVTKTNYGLITYY